MATESFQTRIDWAERTVRIQEALESAERAVAAANWLVATLDEVDQPYSWILQMTVDASRQKTAALKWLRRAKNARKAVDYRDNCSRSIVAVFLAALDRR